MSVKILEGDCLETLRTLEAGSVHCVVTSPPYWGLRDYGLPGSEWPAMEYEPLAGSGRLVVAVPAWSGCLGLEPDPMAFVGHIVAVFREVRRVLREDGTCWVNFGDSYASAASGSAQSGLKALSDQYSPRAKPRENHAYHAVPSGFKAKDLCGIPWRVALALQADGWYLRSDIIWHKPNPMPESCTDRPTKAHEYFFLLTKSARYFYDQEAIRESVAGTAHARGNGVNPKAAKFPTGWAAEGTHTAIDHMKQGKNFKASRPKQNASFSGAVNELVSDRNKRTVWTVTTRGYAEAHFATFPPDLIRPCILAGTSERGCCAKCGAPWERVVEKGEPDLEHRRACGGDEAGEYHGEAIKPYGGTKAQNASEVKARILEGMRKRVTTNWVPTCRCYAERDSGPLAPVPCTVLDPFGGSGTTAAVAIEHGRRAVLCEMKAEYVKLIRKRLDQTQPGLF